MTNIVYNLLKDVQRFYPIGMPELYEHPRLITLERDSIVEAKIIALQNRVTGKWEMFVDELLAAGIAINNQSYLQNPGYTATIPLYSQEQGENKHQRELVINLSLLCPHFTMFYLETFRFDELKHERPFGPSFRVAHTNHLAELEGNLYNAVSTLLTKHYENYSCVSHALLLKRYISSSLQLGGQAKPGPYPIYSYLFDEFFNLNNLEVQL